MRLVRSAVCITTAYLWEHSGLGVKVGETDTPVTTVTGYVPVLDLGAMVLVCRGLGE